MHASGYLGHPGSGPWSGPPESATGGAGRWLLDRALSVIKLMALAAAFGVSAACIAVAAAVVGLWLIDLSDAGLQALGTAVRSAARPG